MVIDHKLFERAFRAWTAELSSRIKDGMALPLAKEHIGIDEKCLKGSADSYLEPGALYLVSAWSEHNKLAFILRTQDCSLFLLFVRYKKHCRA